MKIIRKNRILALLLALLFLCYYGSATLFLHTHYVNNGDVTHSHPFSETSHSHSNAEYQLIQNLSQIATTIITMVTISCVVRLFIAVIQKVQTHIAHKNVITFKQLRAPPVIA